EVVEVIYDTEVIEGDELDAIAKENSCSAMAKPGKFTQDKTPKYYLSNSPYKVVPMTETQKSRVNAALGEGLSPNQFLSPRQLAYFKKVQKKKVEGMNLVKETDFQYAWNSSQL
ncbi:MAG: hypothetical protein AAGK97_04480, partial [Bacteroidota bacterium]